MAWACGCCHGKYSVTIHPAQIQTDLNLLSRKAAGLQVTSLQPALAP